MNGLLERCTPAAGRLSGVPPGQPRNEGHGLARALRTVWCGLFAPRPDPRTRHLAAAIDHADLERRMCTYDEQAHVITTPWPSL